MFYQRDLGPALRFGDIVRGFIFTTPDVNAPFVGRVPDGYRVEVNQPTYSVILSPCCSISDKVLSLAPLIQIRPAFFKNPYWAEDLTRINRKMNPENTLPPDAWEKLVNEEKQKRLHEGIAYVFKELFVYAGHEILPKYSIHRKEGDIETNYYMIDFRNVSRVNCEKVITAENSPLEAKCLELSVETRAELREKVAAYFARIPKEDLLATA